VSRGLIYASLSTYGEQGEDAGRTGLRPDASALTSCAKQLVAMVPAVN
jgi:crotonobetainyl-CoA:carnitine CoA-transferase CaiB-like acyl-CoA transferase